MPKKPTFNRVCSSGNALRCSFSFDLCRWREKGSLKFFSIYVFWKHEHNSSIFSISLESRESCSHTLWYLERPVARRFQLFQVLQRPKLVWVSEPATTLTSNGTFFFNPRSPILRMKFCDKWEQLRGLKLHLFLWSIQKLFRLQLFPKKSRGCGSLELKVTARYL